MWWAKDDEASAGSSRSCTVLAARTVSTIRNHPKAADYLPVHACMNGHFPRAASQHLRGEHTCICSWWV